MGVLDDINEKAEKERARQAVMQAKEEERVKKEQEKAEKAEQRRLAKEEKRKSKSGTADDQEEETAPTDTARASGDDAILNDEVHPAMDTENREADTMPPIDSTLGTPPSPEAARSLSGVRSGADEEHQEEHRGDHRHSSGSKLKGWIKNRLSRGRSSERGGDAADEEKKKKRISFFKGSGALKKDNPNASNASLENGPSSMRDVAIAGHADGEASHAAHERDSRGVSPVSSVYEAPDRLEPPKPI